MGVEVAEYGLLLHAAVASGVQLAAVGHDIAAVDYRQVDELVDRIELRKGLVGLLYAVGLHAEFGLEMLHNAVDVLRLDAVEVRDRLHGEKAQRLRGYVARAENALEHGV